MGPFETTLRRHIREADADAASDHSLSQLRRRDAEALRRLLRTWEASTTPEGRRAAALGLPTGPLDGGFA